MNRSSGKRACGNRKKKGLNGSPRDQGKEHAQPIRKKVKTVHPLRGKIREMKMQPSRRKGVKKGWISKSKASMHPRRLLNDRGCRQESAQERSRRYSSVGTIQCICIHIRKKNKSS
jgi:hypothetical protein